MTVTTEPTTAGAIFTDRRTVNNFSDEPVTDADLAQIWDYAKFTPTALNSQPLRVLFVRTPEAKQRLLGHMAEFNQAKTASAPVTAVLAYDPNFHEFTPTTFPHNPGMKDVFEANPEMKEGTGRLSAGIQSGGFILAVRAAGLWAGPMTGFDSAGVDAEFFAENGWRSLVVVNIGHPGESPYFDRLPRVPEDAATIYA
jgi:3-hydroxypropanoate dehydrogenase